MYSYVWFWDANLIIGAWYLEDSSTNEFIDECDLGTEDYLEEVDNFVCGLEGLTSWYSSLPLS